MKTATYDSFERLAARFIVCQFLILAVLVGLSMLNEVAELPHRWFGAFPATAGTHWAEVGIEAAAFGLVGMVEVLFIRRLRSELRVLHGLLPVCRGCRRILHDGQWVPLEDYITKHSMAFFHQTSCRECHAIEPPPGAGPAEEGEEAPDGVEAGRGRSQSLRLPSWTLSNARCMKPTLTVDL